MMQKIEWKELKKNNVYLFKLTGQQEVRGILIDIDIDHIEVRELFTRLTKLIPKNVIKEIYIMHFRDRVRTMTGDRGNDRCRLIN